MQVLARRNPAVVLDLLAERLAFERRSARLHDRVISAVRAPHVPEAREVRDALSGMRDQEDEHVRFLEGAIRSLGGDPEHETPRSRLAALELSGLEQAARADGDPIHLVHALAAAERMNAAGWSILVRLAQRARDEEARQEFLARHRDEVAHELIVRDLLELLARGRVRRAA